ncbi:MAG: glycosyltransferase family 2 protein [Bacteroidetes bacterium]|nr:glycosyltransferase family 2 protein [Bacteroidota bacterium]
MDEARKIGIVTVTFNSGPVLRPFLDCLLRQTYSNYILYAIDNVSTDDSVAIVRQYNDDRIRLIENSVNSGVAGGNNQGIFEAFKDNCDLILLINNDVEFEDTCFEKLVAAIDDTGYSMIAPKMMYYFDKSLIWYAGSNFIPRLGNVAHHDGLRAKDEGQFDTPKEVEYSPTCCILFRKEVFEDIGFADEQYFAYFDDTDLLLRAHKDGRHKMWYYPNMEFYHKIGQSSQSKKGGISKFKFGDFHIKLTTRNHVYFLRKQRTVIAWLNVFYFYLRLNLRFLISGKYNVNFKTWKLIQRSFLEGLKLPLPKESYHLIYNSRKT